MRTPNQLALLLSKLASPSHRKASGSSSWLNASPAQAGFHGFICARNVVFSLPDAAASTLEVKPEASYLALFISMLIKCLSSERELKALCCCLLHPTAGMTGSFPPPPSVPGLLVQTPYKDDPQKWVQPCFLFSSFKSTSTYQAFITLPGSRQGSAGRTFCW